MVDPGQNCEVLILSELHGGALSATKYPALPWRGRLYLLQQSMGDRGGLVKRQLVPHASHMWHIRAEAIWLACLSSAVEI